MTSLRNRLSSSSRHSRSVPNSVRCGDPGLSREFFTRKHSSKIRFNDLPMEPNHLGFHSPWAFLWYFFFLIAPLAYIYITLMLLRDLCEYFPETIQEPLDLHLPFLGRLTTMMKSYYGCRLVDIWCIIEAVFFIYCKIKIRYLQSKDPLEACLSAAPMLDPGERKALWDHMMAVESDLSWLSGWFLDKPSIDSISLYDINDFFCWAMFDGRNQEHLTTDELNDLEGFIEETEYRISIQMYGVIDEEESGNKMPCAESKERTSGDFTEKALSFDDGIMGNRNRTLSDTATAIAADIDNISSYKYDAYPANETKLESPNKYATPTVLGGEISSSIKSGSWSSFQSIQRPRPKLLFRFRRDIEREELNYFSNLYETYKVRYDRYKNMIENADFHPVKDFRNHVAGVAKTAHSVEESAIKSAQNMYETIIQPGSRMEKHLSAFGHATSIQLSEAWNSVKGMKQQLETANFLSKKRSALMQQLRGNRAMLTRMREMSYAVNSKQMASLLRKITESYEALENIETMARDGFFKAAGKFADHSLFKVQEPRRYARFSSDPILGIAASPLCITLFLLSATELSLRFLLKKRGFERKSIGPITYYHHPGAKRNSYPMGTENSEYDSISSRNIPKTTPVVFVHGIGVGLISYVPLIDVLMETGRPIFLPELPFVSAFRPWQSSRNVLSPAVVASTVCIMPRSCWVTSHSKITPSFHIFLIFLMLFSVADDSHVGLSWFFKGDFRRTLIRNFLVIVRLQKCP